VSFVEDIETFAARSINATHVHEKLVLGLVSDPGQIEQATGLDVTNYVHILDNFGLKHGFKHHGDESYEAPRGQRAVMATDILRVPETVAHPDRITFDGLSKHSRQPVIGFEKDFGNETLVYKAEVRKGKKEIATQTFYVRRGK
jgi:hypothetical protein